MRGARRPRQQSVKIMPDEVTATVERPVALVKRSLTIEGVRLADWAVSQ